MNRLSRSRAIVFDFDGTLTHADFDSGFEAALLDRIQRAEGLSLEARVRSDDRDADVIVDGRAVVRAGADPWILATFRAMRALAAAGLDDDASRAMIARHFRPTLDERPAPFRDGVGEAIDALGARGTRCFVVSNSPAHSIRARLDAVSASAASVVVVGDAHKFTVADATHPLARTWQERLGEVRSFATAPRPIEVRRGRYLDALARVCALADCAIEELTVVGDVFELDLVVPLSLGAHACSIDHEGRADWERDAIESLGGHTNLDLRALVDVACATAR